MRRGSLSAGDRDAPATAPGPEGRSALRSGLSALEDRPAAGAAPAVLAPQPARAPSASISRSSSVAGTVSSVKRTRVEPAAAGRQLVDAERADAVVLAGAPDLDDPVRALDLGERHVGPAEAVAGAFTRKRAPAPLPTESIRVRCQSTR